MKTNVSRYQFVREFEDSGRGTQFSREALDALFEYFEEYEDSTGTEIEFDVVAICCDYSESTFAELIEQYDIPIDSDYGKSEESQIVDWLNDRTNVVAVLDDSIVYLSF
jgi:hypothetical protein